MNAHNQEIHHHLLWQNSNAVYPTISPKHYGYMLGRQGQATKCKVTIRETDRTFLFY